MRPIARASAFSIASLLSACAPVRRETTIVEIAHTRPASNVHRTPAKDETTAVVERRDATAHVHVERQLMCEGDVRDHRVVEARTREQVDASVMRLEGAVAALGAAVLVGAAIVNGRCDHTPRNIGRDVDPCDPPPAFPATIAGAAMLGIGGPALLVDAFAAKHARTTTEQKAIDGPITPVPFRCGTLATAGASVVVRLASSTRITGTTDASGDAELAAPEEAWSASGGIEGELFVDGARVRIEGGSGK
jgi:hypothetical protein